ncbi:hypothetical protein CesoFtcFv8_003031 [Champsocephalus esox]|uniref:Uncharacterized protein n=1 Tax=Champsocephalus esox TaxID=159716 RepID=A0AAN8CZ62_9TELE|nr:hypothetical protein CesoFtcFv8_003031 [Champsocephalus esox]
MSEPCHVPERVPGDFLSYQRCVVALSRGGFRHLKGSQEEHACYRTASRSVHQEMRNVSTRSGVAESSLTGTGTSRSAFGMEL